jgi:signal transduction histidine kinase
VVGVPPPGLGHGGIVPAIADLATRTPVPVKTVLPEEFVSDADVETTLYYVVSESITNAIKHSGASQIEVSIVKEGEDLVLHVTDDGRGGADSTGSGLLGLADRVAARGGRLRVESTPGAGTTITAVIPNRSSPTA